MAEVLIFSDIHIHAHKQSTKRLQDCLKVLEWVFETAVERGVGDVLFLGDLFHDRSRLDINVLHRTHEIFERYFRDPKFRLHLLVGNHDMWSRDRWDTYSPSAFTAWEAVEAIDQPCTKHIQGVPIDFLPFTENPLVDLGNLRDSGSAILCSHLAIDGAMLNSFGMTADVCVEHDGEMVKVDAEFLKGWRRVFLGHYHAPQQIDDRVEYIGSPLQLTFSETGQEKHLLLYDLESDHRSYIVNDFSPRHIVTSPDKIDSIDMDGHFVMVRVEDFGAAEVVDLRRDINQKYDVASLTIQAIPQEVEEDQATVEEAKAVLQTDDVMLRRYVDEKGTGELDPDQLLKIGTKITEGPPCLI